MSIEAMKLALEALENTYAYLPRRWGGEVEADQAITALRQAIAEAEKQEQKTPLKVLGLTVFTENRLRNGRVYDVETLQAMTNRDILAIPDMGKKALKEVLEALDVYASDISQEHVHKSDKHRHEWGLVTDDALIEEVRRRGFTIRDAQILPKIKDEYELCCQKYDTCTEPCTPRGRHLAKREWVGLTDDEFQACFDHADGTLGSLMYAIEAKLKEKNT